jgi:Zn-dependent peptidase ImmA (M78 family)
MRINSEMVVLAREYRGLTQGKLAVAAQFSQPKIARMESGIGADLDPDEVARLSEALNFPVEFFLQDEVRVGFGSSSYYYRKKASLTAGDRKTIQSVVNLKRIHLKRLLSAVDMDYTRPFRRLDLEDYGGRPENVARALRSFWQIPDGPIADLTAAVESAGVLVVPCNFGTKELDGTSIWLGDLPPLIFMRDDLPGDRWRFTLAHELAHLLMHEVPTELMEDQADKFAAELLMPERDIRPHLARYASISIHDLANLKSYWKVAMSALLRRSRDLGYTSDNQARYLYQRMSALGYRTHEPVQVEREQPKVIRQLFNCFADQMDYDAAAFAAFLRARKEDIEELHQGELRPQRVERPKLRIVS